MMRLFTPKLPFVLVCFLCLFGEIFVGISQGWAQATPPESVKKLKIVAIAAGDFHALALTADGTVVGWGNNINCQATPPKELDNIKVIAIAAGGNHSLALTADHKVVGWGQNNLGQAKLPDKFKHLKFIAISAGFHHSLALTDDRKVIGWGDDHYRQYFNYDPNLPSGNFRAIAAGGDFSLALDRYGKIEARGEYTTDKQNYAPWPDGRTHPSPPHQFWGHFKAIAAGGAHGLVLGEDGSVRAWGGNQYGQANVPQGYGIGGRRSMAIAAGFDHSLLLTESGGVVGWGRNQNGQVDFSSDTGVKAIAAGTGFSLGLRKDGVVIGWGFDKFNKVDEKRVEECRNLPLVSPAQK